MEEAEEAVAAVDVATTTIAVDVVEDQARTSKSGLVLLVYVAKELHRGAFADLGAAKQQAVREDAEERFISYAFLRQSGVQHGNLKVDLQNDFTTGYNRYPKNRQQTLHLLEKYSKTVVPEMTPSEGTSFVQESGRGGAARPSEMTLKLIQDGSDDAEIPGVHFDADDDVIPRADIVELPGVDVAEQDLEDPAPQIVAIDDLDIPTPDLPPVEVETTVRDDPNLEAAPVEPAPLADDEEPPSVETLNPIEALTAAEHDTHIPGVDVAALPGPDDFVKIPGVDGGDFPVPDPVETTVLDAIAEPPVIAAGAVASAPVSEVQPAVTNEGRRSMEIPTQTATALPIESHRVSHPDATMFVIKDGSKRAAPQVGHEAATKVGTRTQHSNGHTSADATWIQVQSKINCRGQRQPLILNAKGTCISYERTSHRRIATHRKFSHRQQREVLYIRGHQHSMQLISRP